MAFLKAEVQQLDAPAGRRVLGRSLLVKASGFTEQGPSPGAIEDLRKAVLFRLHLV
jgi:hypothetical protein